MCVNNKYYILQRAASLMLLLYLGGKRLDGSSGGPQLVKESDPSFNDDFRSCDKLCQR